MFSVTDKKIASEGLDMEMVNLSSSDLLGSTKVIASASSNIEASTNPKGFEVKDIPHGDIDIKDEYPDY